MGGFTESDLKKLHDALNAFEKRCAERHRIFLDAFEKRYRISIDALEKRKVGFLQGKRAVLEAKTSPNKLSLANERPKLASKEQLDQWASRRNQKELDKIPSLSW